MFRRLTLFLALWTLAVMTLGTQAHAAAVDFELQGVLISPSSRSALINGHVAREGERVAGVEILAIEEGAVRVLTGSQEYTVPVGSSAWLQPSVARQQATRVRHVKRGDTLSRIAEDYAGDGISLNQVVVALFEANPDAFDGNINQLRAGAVLQVPEIRDISDYPPDTAMAEVLRQTDSWRKGETTNIRVAEAPPDSEYGPVRFGETLSEIAVQVSGDGISMNEMMTALFEANPQAFGDNIDLLHEGAVLRIPDMQERRQYEILTAHTS